MQKLLIALILVAAFSCKSYTGKTTTEDSAVTVNTNQQTERAAEKPADIGGCYMQVLKRDTFAAILQQHDNIITGKLSFDNYEKDGSSGTVSGKLDGDIMKLFYSFASEGMNTVMEVYFKLNDGKLLRGTGEMANKGDTAYFTNPAAIKYDGTVMQKLSCEHLPAMYK